MALEHEPELSGVITYGGIIGPRNTARFCGPVRLGEPFRLSGYGDGMSENPPGEFWAEIIVERVGPERK